MYKILFSVILILSPVSLYSQPSTISYNGQQIFLNGVNAAWINFGADIGNGNTDTAGFRNMFRKVHDYGGNVVRLWLHTNGAVTPQFSGPKVTGPGNGTIQDLKNICDLAYKNDIGLILCLWSFDMLRKTNSTEVKTRNRGILTVDSLMNSYINNALIPMVTALKEHPGILAWEIFNEPEGMTPVGNWNEVEQVQITNVQKFVNRCTGAIHRTDPKAKVTNGSWSSISATDIGGGTNYYTDARLIARGGDPDGKLDFYCFHYYDNIGQSPFEHPYSYWQLDKPLVIAEFYPYCSHCGTGSSFENLYKNGYAGAMGWAWNESHAGDIRTEMQYMLDNHTSGVDINRFLKNTPSLKVLSPLPNSTFALTDTVKFRVQVKDTDGEIQKVTYKAGNDVIAVVTAAPFNYNWARPAESKYKITVSVTDADGFTKEADPFNITVGNPPVKIFEAENAFLSGTAKKVNDASASNGAYVSFDQTGYMEFTLPKAPEAGNYNIKIAYRIPYGNKNQYVMVNNDASTRKDVVFDGPVNEWQVKTLNFPLKTQENKLKIEASWGYMHFDYVELPFGVVTQPTPVNSLGKSNMKVYPTLCKPNDIITIELDNQIFQHVNIRLNDLSGKLISNIYSKGRNQEMVPLSGLKPGMYILRISNGRIVETMKVVVE